MMKCKDCKASQVIDRETWNCVCGVKEKDLKVIGNEYGCDRTEDEVEKEINKYGEVEE